MCGCRARNIRVNIIIRYHGQCIGIYGNYVNPYTDGSRGAGSAGCQPTGIARYPYVVFGVYINPSADRHKACFIVYGNKGIAAPGHDIEHAGHTGFVRNAGGVHDASLNIIIIGIYGNIAPLQFRILSYHDEAFSPHVLIGHGHSHTCAGRTAGIPVGPPGTGNGDRIGFSPCMNLLITGSRELRPLTGQYNGTVTQQMKRQRTGNIKFGSIFLCIIADQCRAGIVVCIRGWISKRRQIFQNGLAVFIKSMNLLRFP